MKLGERAKLARTAKGWSLPQMCEILTDFGAGTIDPSTLKRMEDGTRPGQPEVWGAIWRALGLPLRELYEGLGLPVPDSEPGGIIGELLSAARGLPPEGQKLVLMFARHAPTYVTVAAGGPLPASAPKSFEEQEREALWNDLQGAIASLPTDLLRQYVMDFLQKAAASTEYRRLDVPPAEPPIPRTVSP